MSALVAVRALRSAINNGTVPWSRSYASTTKATQQKQSGGGGGGSGSGVQIKNPDPPSNVFKKSTTSEIGPGASKEGQYKNPEYFQYHNMSFAEMEIVMAKMRVPQPSAKQAK